MKMKYNLLTLVSLIVFANFLYGADHSKQFELKSPDNKLAVIIQSGNTLTWSVNREGKSVISPSTLSLQLNNGVIPGSPVSIKSVEKRSNDNQFITLNYFRSVIKDHYNQITLNFKNDFSLVFRAYDDAIAYRFISTKKDSIIIVNEEANFNFTSDYKAFIPYMWDYRGGKKFNHSFEALYRESKLSQFAPDSLAFLPLLVDEGNQVKVVILEADLDDYPGMYLDLNSTGKGLKGVFANYPIQFQMGGYENMNEIPTVRTNYIAKTSGTRNFPWRVAVISTSDKQLLDNDIVQRLASPSRIDDTSWIKPGLVAWDWWNDWNISHVDFKAGYNTPTYKYYIDFAAENHLPYIVIDWGWSSRTDLFKLTAPDLNLQEIIDYGKQKGVGVVLWSTWVAARTQADTAFPYYAKMGIKGFKIDFVDRDDQLAVASLYEIAKKAAQNKLIVDYHGVFKPTGLQRTYPNVVGYEGVKGLENYKWANEDQPRYTVSIPFIRMMAGPMDYTPGSMHNTTKANFFANNSVPQSKGTRCNQMAMNIIYYAPFQMLSDNPTIYKKEQECTTFISKIPTVTDETVPLGGEVGEYAAIARRKGDTWFVGAMTNWTPRELTIDFSFLGEGNYSAELFRDGSNADHDATDYKKETISVKAADKLKIQLAPGGGWVARIVKN
jgi:alpha-glucosidase